MALDNEKVNDLHIILIKPNLSWEGLGKDQSKRKIVINIDLSFHCFSLSNKLV